MGRKLVIKDADFAVNGMASGVLTFYNNYTDEVLHGSATSSSSNSFYMLGTEVTRLNLDGKTVRYAKLYAAKAGTVSIGRFNGSAIVNMSNYSVKKGVNIIALLNAITISSSSTPAVAGNGVLTFWANNDDDYGWSYNREGGSASTYASYRYPISFGAYEVPTEQE